MNPVTRIEARIVRAPASPPRPKLHRAERQPAGSRPSSSVSPAGTANPSPASCHSADRLFLALISPSHITRPVAQLPHALHATSLKHWHRADPSRVRRHLPTPSSILSPSTPPFPTAFNCNTSHRTTFRVVERADQSHRRQVVRQHRF